MSRVRLGLQVAVILGLFVVVSWPERTPRAAAPSGEANRPAAGVRRLDVGAEAGHLYAIPRSGAIGGLAPRRGTPDADSRLPTPEEVHALGARLNAVIGTTRTPMSTPIPHGRVGLRDVQTGRIVSRATAREDGAFRFLDVTPGGYIVEQYGPDGSVIAVSSLVPVALRGIQETSVTVAGGDAWPALFAGFAGTAHEPIGAAANGGASRVAQPATTISPQR